MHLLAECGTQTSHLQGSESLLNRPLFDYEYKTCAVETRLSRHLVSLCYYMIPCRYYNSVKVF
ncbi:unnamed protein product [Schistosoma mattheei]|uniref:Uncharacterized protein n=1 Tax=Schistosoma mattheei TaxID=31246 RepID=A0A183NLT8_9TREM|nr:unnamed protein product [Schistosoma mattheei]